MYDDKRTILHRNDPVEKTPEEKPKYVEPEFKQCPACFGQVPYRATACMHCGFSPNTNKALGAIGLWLFFH